MPFLLLAVFLMAGVTSASFNNARQACNADNCLRQVRASTAPARGASDCSAFQIRTSTVSGAPTAATPTITETVYSIYGSPISSPSTTPPSTQGPSPTTIPAYASSCGGSAPRYSSACSCIGIIATTITISTVTPAAVTTTSTIVACRPANRYGHTLSSGSYTPPLGTVDKLVNFTGNSRSCCAACFQHPGCMIYEAIEATQTCYLTTYQNGPLNNPNNAVCRAGIATGDFTRGDSLGRGPCLRL